MPRDDSLSFDRPTSACLLGTALLSALGAAAKDTLEGNNLRAFLAEVRRRRGMSILGVCVVFWGRGVEQSLVYVGRVACSSLRETWTACTRLAACSLLFKRGSSQVAWP